MEHDILADILAAVADGAMTTLPSRLAGRGSKRKRDTLEFGVKLLFLLCGCVAVGCVLFICIYLIIAGLPAVLEIGITDFLFGTEWAGKQGQFGILPFILTSVAGTAGAVLVGVPVGILTAMFLAKVAPPRAARVIRTAVEPAGGDPLHRLWPGGHDRTGPRHSEDIPAGLWGHFAGGHRGSGSDDPALYHQCGGDCFAGGSPRI